MYQKGAKGWLKHFDFMLLDLIVLQLSFLVAFQIRHGMVNPYANRDYLALAIITELADIVAMIFLNTYEGVIRRGYFKEFISSFKNGFVIVALLLLYVFVLKDTSIYSRTTILLMWVEKFKGILTAEGAEIINEENWGLKKLAYPIQKKSTGFYQLIEFKAEPQVIEKLEINFRRDERVIRFLTFKMDKYAAEYAAKRRNVKSTKKED